MRHGSDELILDLIATREHYTDHLDLQVSGSDFIALSFHRKCGRFIQINWTEFSALILTYGDLVCRSFVLTTFQSASRVVAGAFPLDGTDLTHSTMSLSNCCLNTWHSAPRAHRALTRNTSSR